MFTLLGTEINFHSQSENTLISYNKTTSTTTVSSLELQKYRTYGLIAGIGTARHINFNTSIEAVIRYEFASNLKYKSDLFLKKQNIHSLSLVLGILI